MNQPSGLERRVQAALSETLGDWSFSPAARLTLLSLSENTVFLVEEAGRRLVLRVHRPGYHRVEEIASELAWIAALRASRVLDTPAPVAGIDGRVLRTLSLRGTEFRVVAFEYVPGRSPEPQEDLNGWFMRLGGISARLHAHARDWTPAPAFRAQTLDGGLDAWVAWTLGRLAPSPRPFGVRRDPARPRGLGYRR